MEVIAVARLLWRRRLLVLVGLVLAAGAAYKLGASPTPSSGFAATQVLLDTSRSQLVTDNPDGVDTLAWRATLAAQLLGTDVSRQRIASDARIPQADLAVTDVELTFPIIAASLPRAAVKAAAETVSPYSVLLHTDDVVPIISISASAPDRETATRLAAATVKTLRANNASTATAEDLGLGVETVSPIESVQIPAGQGRKKVVVFAVVLFGMWIGALTLVPALLRGIRDVMAGGDVVRS